MYVCMYGCAPSLFLCLDFTLTIHAEDTENEDMDTLLDVLLYDFDECTAESEPNQLISSMSVPQTSLTINPNSQIEVKMATQSTDRDDYKFIEMIALYLQENDHDPLFLSSTATSSSSSSRADTAFPSSNMKSPNGFTQASESDENSFIDTLLEQLCRGDCRNGF